MDGHGLSFARVAQAAEGWLPLVAVASSLWLFYAASELDTVGTAAPAPATACDTQTEQAVPAARCASVTPPR